MADYNRRGRGETLPIDLQSILRDIKKSIVIILLLSISAAMLTYTYFSFIHVPEYTVRTTMAVSSQGTDSNVYTNLSSAQTMAQTMQAILGNNILKKTVSEELGINIDHVKTSVSRVSESNLITLSVTGHSPQEAFLVLKSILKNYPTLTDYVMPDVVLDTLQQPTISARSSNILPMTRYMERAFLITAGIIILIISAFSYLRDTVKNTQEFERKVDAKLLGSIYHEKKKRRARSMLISNPTRSVRYVESYRLISSRIKGRMDRRNAKVLLVTSVIENEGKSTVASNIALALSQENKKVLLMDCDFRKPAIYKIFDYDGACDPDLSDIVRGKRSMEGLLRQLSRSSLFLAFCKKTIGDGLSVFTSGRLKELVDYLRNEMDYIILDTPPMAIVADAEEIVNLADAAVVVVHQDLVYTQDINDAIDALNEKAEEPKVIGCVFNDVHPQFGDQYARGSVKADR